jgi:hypothetical protein
MLGRQSTASLVGFTTDIGISPIPKVFYATGKNLKLSLLPKEELFRKTAPLFC